MNFKFGLDPILGLIPGLGDAIPLILGGYIVFVGVKLDLPPEKITKMIGNLVADFFLSSIPVVGDISDLVFKANVKNLNIIKEHLSDRPREAKYIS